MRSWMLLVALVPLSGEAPPQEDVQFYEQSIASRHFADATAAVDRLIAQRTPADGKPRVDPQLNALIGRLYAAEGEYAGAALYLDRANVADLAQSQRGDAALAYASALETLGDRARALTAYREAAADPSNNNTRRAAVFGVARALLAENPAAAAAEAESAGTDRDASDRWQQEYLLALADSLQGYRAAAARLADQAWSDAIRARVADLAPLHVEVLRAGLAAANHEVETERAMLAAAGGLSISATAALAMQLPVCGTGGVQPSDYVIFGFLTGPYRHQLIPISASRRDVVKTFYDSLALTVPVAGKGEPFGTVFTAACRRVASADVRTGLWPHEPIVQWFVDHGIYPASTTYQPDDKHLNAVADRVDALTARFGKDSPLLIWPRYQLMQLLEARARGGDPVVPGQITDLAQEVSAGLRRDEAPEWLSGMIEMQSKLIEMVARGGHGEEQIVRSREMMKENMAQMPPELTRDLIIQEEASHRGEWNAAAARIVLDLSGKITPALSGLGRQSWLMTVAHAQRAVGLDQAARESLAAAGLDSDSCARMDEEPKLLQQKFSFEDYPQALLSGDQEGAVLFEFNLASDGAVSEHRIVYSLPSGLFDGASEKGLQTVRYSAPVKDGKESFCNSVYQPIVWRLENLKGPGLPVFRPYPGVDQPTT